MGKIGGARVRWAGKNRRLGMFLRRFEFHYIFKNGCPVGHARKIRRERRPTSAWLNAGSDRRASLCLGGGTLADRAFHLKLDQALELDAVFHWELPDKIVHKPVHAQTHRLRFGQSALLHVENLLRAHLADACLWLNRVVASTDGDRRMTVGVAGGII